MQACLKRVSQKEILLPLVKYLYQPICLRPKNQQQKKKSQVAQQEITLAALSFFFPIKLETFLVESELVGTQIDQQD